MPYAEFHCVHLLYSSVQFEKIWGGAGTKGVGSRGSICFYIHYVLNESHPMALTRAGLFIWPDRKADVCHCPSKVLSSLELAEVGGTKTGFLI